MNKTLPIICLFKVRTFHRQCPTWLPILTQSQLFDLKSPNTIFEKKSSIMMCLAQHITLKIYYFLINKSYILKVSTCLSTYIL